MARVFQYFQRDLWIPRKELGRLDRYHLIPSGQKGTTRNGKVRDQTPRFSDLLKKIKILREPAEIVQQIPVSFYPVCVLRRKRPNVVRWDASAVNVPCSAEQTDAGADAQRDIQKKERSGRYFNRFLYGKERPHRVRSNHNLPVFRKKHYVCVVNLPLPDRHGSGSKIPDAAAVSLQQ